MNAPQWPEARVGQEITAALWNLARAANRANRLRAGVGVRLRWTPDGTIINADVVAPNFNHSFRVDLAADALSATITPGTVNALPVLIDGVPLDDEPAPVLTWKQLAVDPQGRGFLALDFACDEQWQILPQTLTLVQLADWRTEDGKPPQTPSVNQDPPMLKDRRTRWPIAMFRQRANGRVDTFAIVQAPLNHRAVPKAADPTKARHFFT